MDYGYRLLVLPVETGGTSTYGDPAAVLDSYASSRQVALPYQYLSAVGRTWGCNSEAVQEETDILAAASAWDGSLPLLVVGFSASGYAAVSLVQRHPDVFAGAIFFDCPLNQQNINRFDMPSHYGTEANFETNYRITDRLPVLAGKSLLMSLTPAGDFISDMTAVAGLMCQNQVGHVARFVSAAHRWDSGWLEDALDNFPGSRLAKPTRASFPQLLTFLAFAP